MIMLNIPENDGYSVLEVDTRNPAELEDGDSGVGLLKRESVDAMQVARRSVRDTIIGVFRTHLVEFLESHRTVIEQKLNGRLDVLASINKIVALFRAEIEAVANEIVKTGSGVSLQFDTYLLASTFVEKTKGRLGMQTAGEAA